VCYVVIVDYESNLLLVGVSVAVLLVVVDRVLV